MEIQVAKERIFLLEDQLTFAEAKEKAWSKRMDAFDAFSKVAGFFSRNQDDLEETYAEHRFQPFWHVTATSKYVYERTTKYQVAVTGPEVKTVTFQDNDYEVMNGHIHIPVLEHCIQEETNEVLVDGITGKISLELTNYLKLFPKLVEGKLEDLVPAQSILVPPQTRVSAIMREALSKMIKGIQADKILEEHVEVSNVDLYYHPVYAFQYHWASKNKDGILEVDGVTGEVRSGSRTFNEYLGQVLDQNFLFDVGADVAGIFIPGGSIAVKVAKKYIDAKKAKGS